ncbi:helix-turn-helix domain-containing protein [Amycolatopsis sp. NPDC051758]|uniref:helix-turn-helix domain-containing protein n=1 Tax=Amycolatopsis sp. NPDC051758 TaxID=3363935 RepID=UPI003791EB47
MGKSRMANDRLRTAMLAVNLTVDRLAVAVDVDPKTAERWISRERVPHRATRHKVVEVLGCREVDLWPSLSEDPHAPPGDTELVRLYPSRSAITATTWTSLLTGLRARMDLQVFSGIFLVEQYDLVALIRAKSAAGVRFRLLVGDESAPAVLRRAVEEGTPGGLEGRVQLMRRYLVEIAGLDGVEVRTHGETLYNSLYRFDDELLVNGHTLGALAGQSPVWHLRRTSAGPIWEHYRRAFERAWAAGVPETRREL